MPNDFITTIAVSLIAASIITSLAILITRPVRSRLIATLKLLGGSKLSGDDLKNRAQLRRSVGEIALAIEDAKSAVQKAPTDPYAHNLMGSLLRQSQSYEDAVDAFSSALSFDPTIAEVHNNLGVVYHDIALKEGGRFDHAREEFVKATELKPEYADALANLGDVFFHEDQFSQAIVYLLRAVEIDPSLARAHNRLGMVYSMTGDFESGLNHLETALKLKKDYPAALNNRAETLYWLGDYESALSDLENISMEESPPHPATFTNLGRVHRILGNYEDALLYIDKALEMRPNHLETRSNRAMILLARNEIAAADQEYRASRELDKGRAWDAYHLSALDARFGHEEESLSRLDAGIRKNAAFKLFARTDPDFEQLRQSAKFVQVLEADSSGELDTRIR